MPIRLCHCKGALTAVVYRKSDEQRPPFLRPWNGRGKSAANFHGVRRATMAAFLGQHYGDCEGPLGIPCLDGQARALEAVLRALPRDDLYAPGHLVVERATTELLPGERCDVSWI